MAKNSTILRQVTDAALACEEKKAEDISILELDKAAGGFTDYFVICSGTNPRQVQAIADEVELRLKKTGERPVSVEGYRQAEWVLLDYVDFVVHVFSTHSRSFYNLERLWKSARGFTLEDLQKKASQKKTAPKARSKPTKKASVKSSKAGKPSAKRSKAVPAKAVSKTKRTPKKK